MDKGKLQEQIVSIFKEFLINVKQIDADTSLKEMGINSISFIKSLIKIESVFGMSFKEDMLDVNFFTSLKEIVDFVYNSMTG